jgi:signal transduction histidine kinase
VNILSLLLPVSAVAVLQVYNDHLVHLTEQALISESVVIGEAWRDRWLEVQGKKVGNDTNIMSMGPITPMISLFRGILPPPDVPSRSIPKGVTPEWSAGMNIQSILDRARQMTRSGARVLDAQGCVVASTEADVGFCFETQPEVKAALAGKYMAVARARKWSAELPTAENLSQAGDLHVFTALPVLADGKVIGVVRMSRLSLAPLKALWLDRSIVLACFMISVLITLTVSYTSARTITRPVQRITDAAQAIVRGEPRQPIASDGVVPSEVYDLSAALDTMTTQLSDRAAYISEFAANVSHELKTPLTGIAGAAELLQDQWTGMSDLERGRFLGNIRGDVDRMQRLVSRLLQLARIQSAPAEAEHIQLRPYFERLTERYDGQVLVDLKGAPESLVIHPDHLDSAVRNLVDNAVRHGEGKPVEVSVREEGGRTVVRVQDHGAGISEGNQKNIFNRFFTTERDHGGTGLGLSIVEAVSRTRGGSVRFETGPSGTTFILTL